MAGTGITLLPELAGQCAAKAPKARNAEEQKPDISTRGTYYKDDEQSGLQTE